MGVAKMLRAVLLVVAAASASAFAPAAVLPRAAQRTATNGPKMQLYNDGIEQGADVTAKYIGWNSLERPLTPAFDGTWAGDVGFARPSSSTAACACLPPLACLSRMSPSSRACRPFSVMPRWPPSTMPP